MKREDFDDLELRSYSLQVLLRYASLSQLKTDWPSDAAGFESPQDLVSSLTSGFSWNPDLATLCECLGGLLPHLLQDAGMDAAVNALGLIGEFDRVMIRPLPHNREEFVLSGMDLLHQGTKPFLRLMEGEEARKVEGAIEDLQRDLMENTVGLIVNLDFDPGEFFYPLTSLQSEAILAARKGENLGCLKVLSSLVRYGALTNVSGCVVAWEAVWKYLPADFQELNPA